MIINYLALSTAGFLQAFSLAADHGAPVAWLQVLSMAFLAHRLNGTSPQNGFLSAMAFSWSWLLGSFWWLYVSLNNFGALPVWLSALSVALLALVLATYYGLAGWAYSKLANHPQCAILLKPLLFASVWGLAEWARGVMFTGFPWGAIGYAHVDGLLSHAAPWVGVNGIGIMAAAVAMTWAILAKQSLKWMKTKPRHMGLLMGALVLCVAPIVVDRRPVVSETTTLTPLSVGLIQGNIPQNEKFEIESGIPSALDWYAQALLRNTSDLVVAPETALPLLKEFLPNGYWQQLEKKFQHGQQAALIGMPWADTSRMSEQKTSAFSNSAIGIAPHQDIYRYDKSHLVPFGEYVPPFFKWFTSMMNIPMGDFRSGPLAQPSFNWMGQRIATNICYEDLFGEEIASGFQNAQTAPTLLVNISNIAWFGNTVVVDQHLQIARMRTLELDRPMVRSTNTGMTAVINRNGQVTAQLPRYTRGELNATVFGYAGPITPYAWWASRWGLWPLAAWALICLTAIWSSIHIRVRRAT